MERLHKAIFWTILTSETMHVFCCVLPLLLSILSLMGSIGVMSFVPASFLAFHEFMHEYERPVIVVSGLVLLLGWGLHWVSKKIDCHDTGCAHEPCRPRKKSAALILKVASLLFVVNTSIYLIFHTS
jgi:hypothetical protein